MLLKWWLEQNPKHRNIWPGIDSERVGGKWKPDEIVNQVKITREMCGGDAGVVHWSIKGLGKSRNGLGAALATTVYSEPALIPASPWLEEKLPAKPKLRVESGKLKWKPAGFEKINIWVLQTKVGAQWQTRLLPAETREQTLDSSPEVIALTLIDRCGVASTPLVLQKSNGTK